MCIRDSSKPINEFEIELLKYELDLEMELDKHEKAQLKLVGEEDNG